MLSQFMVMDVLMYSFSPGGTEVSAEPIPSAVIRKFCKLVSRRSQRNRSGGLW
jgi:hypothetical protein